MHGHTLLTEYFSLVSERVVYCCRYPRFTQRITAILPRICFQIQRTALQQASVVESLILNT